MTELEKIEYTKSFLDKLANGIDPIENKPIPEADLLNNIRVSRCMFYVSDILRQIIENGGITPAKKTKVKKAPFSITPEQLEKYEYSDIPLSLSEIAGCIKELVDYENMKTLSYKDLASWLINVGMLYEKEDSDCKMKKHPTDAGESLGIYEELRHNAYNDYKVVVYDKDAQKFIIDNIYSIIAFKNKENAE